MVRIDSFSSVPPHIQPPMAQVPSAIREAIRFVPLISMYSNMVSLPAPFIEKSVSLAKPLGVGVRAIEVMRCLIKLELAGFRGFRRFCKKRCNLGRVERLETTGRVESLLKNRLRIAARNDDTRREVHRIVEALHGAGGFTHENKVVAHRLHAEHADIVLEQDRQDSSFETVEVRVHYVERHLD